MSPNAAGSGTSRVCAGPVEPLSEPDLASPARALAAPTQVCLCHFLPSSSTGHFGAFRRLVQLLPGQQTLVRPALVPLQRDAGVVSV